MCDSIVVSSLAVSGIDQLANISELASAHTQEDSVNMIDVTE